MCVCVCVCVRACVYVCVCVCEHEFMMLTLQCCCGVMQHTADTVHTGTSRHAQLHLWNV